MFKGGGGVNTHEEQINIKTLKKQKNYSESGGRHLSARGGRSLYSNYGRSVVKISRALMKSSSLPTSQFIPWCNVHT